MNDACVHDPFPTPFRNEVLDQVAGNEAYSFTYGFFIYHHIQIAKEYMKNNTFNIEWGSFFYNVMLFGLKNAPTVFSRIIIATFSNIIHMFLEVYLDDWNVYKLLEEKTGILHLMLDHYRQLQISLNL